MSGFICRWVCFFMLGALTACSVSTTGTFNKSASFLSLLEAQDNCSVSVRKVSQLYESIGAVSPEERLQIALKLYNGPNNLRSVSVFPGPLGSNDADIVATTRNCGSADVFAIVRDNTFELVGEFLIEQDCLASVDEFRQFFEPRGVGPSQVLGNIAPYYIAGLLEPTSNGDRKKGWDGCPE